MVSFIGNNIRPNGIGLIPPRKVIEGGYRTIIGNSSGLFSTYLNKSNLIHACDIKRYILYNGVFTGPFVANAPAWRNVSIPGYGTVPLLQVERTSSNLFTYSEVFRQAISDWVNQYTDVSDNSVASPIDSNFVADKIYEDTTDQVHLIYQSISVVSGTQYTCSTVFKKSERYKFQHHFGSVGFPGTPKVIFDLDAGTVITNGGYEDYKGITSLINNWYAGYMTATSDNTGTVTIRLRLINDDGSDRWLGDGSSGLYLVGAQIEPLAWRSSYIKTNGSSEIRPKTEARIDAANVPNWVKDRFIIPWVPYGSSDQFSSTNHILCEMRDSVEDWTLYFEGSTGKVKLDGSVTGNVLEKSAITFSGLDDLLLAHLILNNTSNKAEITIEGADSGDGSQVGDQAISFDGDLHILTDHIGGNEGDGLGWILKP